MLKELRCRIVICWLPWLRIIRHSGHAKRAHRRAGAMGAFGFPQKAYGHQKLIIKHPSQGEAKSARGSQWANGLRHHSSSSEFPARLPVDNTQDAGPFIIPPLRLTYCKSSASKSLICDASTAAPMPWSLPRECTGMSWIRRTPVASALAGNCVLASTLATKAMKRDMRAILSPLEQFCEIPMLLFR